MTVFWIDVLATYGDWQEGYRNSVSTYNCVISGQEMVKAYIVLDALLLGKQGNLGLNQGGKLLLGQEGKIAN
jgi:hypothetical protein